LDILDDLFRFLQAPRPDLAVRLDGLDLVTLQEGIDNFGRKTPIGLEFDIGMFHQEIKFHLDPAQHADALSKVIDCFSEDTNIHQCRECYDDDYYLIHAGPPYSRSEGHPARSPEEQVISDDRGEKGLICPIFSSASGDKKSPVSGAIFSQAVPGYNR
jgi:hypothetical protein